jgi:hypothetical protein
MARAASKSHNAATNEGLAIERRFSTDGVHPFDEIEWEMRDAIIGDPADPAFEQRQVEFPKTWTQNATNIVAQKYFRGTLGTPERESSLKQVIDRVADTITTWGIEGGYFVDADEADAFRTDVERVCIDDGGCADDGAMRRGRPPGPSARRQEPQQHARRPARQQPDARAVACCRAHQSIFTRGTSVHFFQ